MDFNKIRKLKLFCGYKDIEPTFDDVPPYMLIIEAAEKGHRGYAFLLFEKIGQLLKDKKYMPAILAGYIGERISSMTGPNDDIHAILFFKDTGKRRPSSNKFDEKLNHSQLVQELVREERISEKQACRKVAQIVCLSPDTIEKSNKRYREHAKRILFVKDWDDAIIEDTLRIVK